MFWLDYAIHQVGTSWRPQGDAPPYGSITEPMEKGLYNVGDIFMVDKDGWLVKIDDLSALVEMYERKSR